MGDCFYLWIDTHLVLKGVFAAAAAGEAVSVGLSQQTVV